MNPIEKPNQSEINNYNCLHIAGKVLSIAGGIIFILTGIYLILAANQILPNFIPLNNLYPNKTGAALILVGSVSLILGIYLSTRKSKGSKDQSEENPLIVPKMAELQENNPIPLEEPKPTSSSSEEEEKLTQKTLTSDQAKALSDQMDLDAPTITGTIYINSTSTGPIRGDNHYQFSKKLKDSSGKPIQVKEDDIYLEIKGDLASGKLADVFSDLAQYQEFIHLPSCLFEGFNEGEKVRFYYNNELVEFTCCQRNNPKSGFVESVDRKQRCVSTDFQTFLACLKDKVRDNRTQVYFDVDLPVQVTFMGRHVSSNLMEIDADGNRKSINDFSFYKQDQKSMRYERIKFLRIDRVAQETTEHHILNIHSTKVNREDIKVIVDKGFNGLHQVWIIIPHQIEKNQLPGVDPNDMKLNEIPFDQTKHRIQGIYEHGQYYVYNLESDKVEVGFNTDGYLQLKIDPPKAKQNPTPASNPVTIESSHSSTTKISV